MRVSIASDTPSTSTWMWKARRTELRDDAAREHIEILKALEHAGERARIRLSDDAEAQ